MVACQVKLQFHLEPGNIQVFVVIGNPIAGEAAEAPWSPVPDGKGWQATQRIIPAASNSAKCFQASWVLAKLGRIRPQVTLRMRGCFKAVWHWQNCLQPLRLPENPNAPARSVEVHYLCLQINQIAPSIALR